MTLEEATKHFGNIYRVCKAINIHPQNGYMWRKRGYIPINQQFRIAAKSGGALQADNFDPRTRTNEENTEDL